MSDADSKTPKATITLAWTRTVSGSSVLEIEAEPLLAWLQAHDDEWTLENMHEVEGDDLKDYLAENEEQWTATLTGPGVLSTYEAKALAVTQ